MPEQSELFELNRKHLIGKLVTSTVSSGRIAEISIPSENQFKHMLVLSASDFAANPEIAIMDESIPIFASDEVSYKGQPVLAVFGYETEDVELFCKEVKVSYQIRPDSEDYKSEQYGEPFVWNYGNTDDFFTEQTKVFKSSFETTPFPKQMLGDQRIFAVKKDSKMHVRVASQWPIHVRKAVAGALGCNLGNVLVYPQSYYAPYDQLIVQPSVLSAIVAMAAEQSGELVELSFPIESWQPRMTIEHETAYLADGTPVADRANCVIDLGAFPIFTAEVCHNILAGMISVYPLKSAEACITIMRSSTPPANFFGDLGYSIAQAGTENHFSNLAISLGMQPGAWKLARVKDIGHKGSPICESIKEGSDFSKLEKSLTSMMESSWYSRKYAANAQKTLYMGKMNPLVNYSRGIGIAVGDGIMGFSQQFNASAKYNLSVTLTEEGQIMVNTGMNCEKSMTNIWKQTIRQFLPVSDEDIFFLDVNDPLIIDLGPSALSRKIGIVSALLMKACSEISRKKEFSRLPITVNADYEADFSDPFYFSSCIGSVAVDLHIDTVMLAPVIDNIWVDIHLGHVFDTDKLLKKARHTITTVLSDICPRISSKCNIEIKVDQDGSFTSSSLTAALRGLTISALVGALSQALGHSIRRVPVTSDDILGIARMNTYGEKQTSTAKDGDK